MKIVKMIIPEDRGERVLQGAGTESWKSSPPLLSPSKCRNRRKNKVRIFPHRLRSI